MKRITLISITLFSIILFLFLFENCGEDEPEANKPPTASISSPANNEAIPLGNSVQISVTANDPEGSISSVVISIDNATVATLQSAPYSYTWNTADATPGQHTIKAVATDKGGLSANAQITVTVTADAPSVTTADITEIGDNSATGGGEVTDDGGVDVTARGVVWSETSGPTVDTNDGFTEDGTGLGAFTSNLTGLAMNTTYYVRAYATNSQGTGYGEEKSFTTTGGALATVVTGDVSNIASGSADCSAEVTDDGGEAVTARGLVWSTMADPTLENNEGSSVDGSGTGSYTGSMTSLTRVTDYAVRAYATNSAGTAYGDPVYFTTLPEPPVVTTADITDITAYLALGGGEVTDDGGAGIVYAGIVWSTSPNPTYENNEGAMGLNGNPFEGLLSGLQPETTYYVRAWAFNDDAHTYVYGEEKSFTTLPFTFQAGNFTDPRDGTQYSTVTINGQTWMAENLAYLPEVCTPDTECGYWVYDYSGTDVAAAEATTNYTDYGVLYSWEMAKAACPANWHLPSDEEWSYLELNIGMPYNQAFGGSDRFYTDYGDRLKETGNAHWTGTNTGTNIAGFNARPGGERDVIDDSFKYMGTVCDFWTSTEIGSPELDLIFRNIKGKVISRMRYSKDNYKDLGLSVRCVQD
jgi:uncharacterized protein (TIGR02145 family)